jgi:SAM-dependent methyltransferase
VVEADIKEQVRRFYNAVGWRQIGEGVYQNARYEDLRPVSSEYLRRCHLRLGRWLPPSGHLILDAGSGPIQYPEYLTYSHGFARRVCLDISHRALVEARNRIGDHGLFVVGDVARLPFEPGVFDAIVSLHTVHHLPADEHEQAFRGLFRGLAPGGRAVTVYSWGDHSPLMLLAQPFIRLAFGLIRLYRRLSGQQLAASVLLKTEHPRARRWLRASGTHTYKHTYAWFQERLSDLPGFEIRVWRSVSTQFLRAFVHRPLFGHFWLRLIYAWEQAWPHVLGRLGQYPAILFEKPARLAAADKR